jgi:outer membrane protein assembly factor BamE (lipoprotein component of BamABCDE complex)
MYVAIFRVFSCTLIIAGCLQSGGCSSNAPHPVSVKHSMDVSDEQAGKLTKENLARIKEGMTLEEVSAVLGPGMSTHEVKEDAVYELGWTHKASKKAIWVKFRGHKVTGAYSSNLQ